MPMTLLQTSIRGVFLAKRQIISDVRGDLYHVMRSDSPEFCGFGEVYVSTLRGRAVKAWKRHKVMHQSITVPAGLVQFVLYDVRGDSPSMGKLEDLQLGEDRYAMLRIPPGIWYGFAGMTTGVSMLVNCASHVYHPDEVDRLPEESDLIPYHWVRQDQK